MNDKLLHFSAGLVIAAPVAWLVGPVYGLAAAFAAGYAKEVRDKLAYGRFDAADFLVTVIGGAVGSAVAYAG